MDVEPGTLRTALTLVKAATLGVLVSLMVIGGLRSDPSPGAAPGTEDAYARIQARADAGQRCSSEQSAAGAAVIRTEAGRLRVVSFATGWAVYNGRRPGELVAVCATPTGATTRSATAP